MIQDVPLDLVLVMDVLYPDVDVDRFNALFGINELDLVLLGAQNLFLNRECDFVFHKLRQFIFLRRDFREQFRRDLRLVDVPKDLFLEFFPHNLRIPLKLQIEVNWDQLFIIALHVGTDLLEVVKMCHWTLLHRGPAAWVPTLKHCHVLDLPRLVRVEV